MLCERLALARDGDRGALGELFVYFGDCVHRSALRLTGNTADAEDVTQDVFLRLPRALAGFTGTSDLFEAWIRRVAVRQALMHLRSGRRRRVVTVDGVANLFAVSDDTVGRLTIDAALQRLSDEHRLVFLLKEVEGYEHREIAELLDITVANSEVRLHRARRELRVLLRGSR
jgi:RNA polymerase sigma-70 factor (ECF subfamily)